MTRFPRMPDRVPVGGLLVLFGVLALLSALVFTGEYLAYRWLGSHHPRLARQTLRHHPLVGPRQVPPGGPQLHGERLDILSFHPLLGWFPRPGREQRGRAGFRVNRRADTLALEPDASVRVFIVGGSTVVGKRLPPEQTISAHLERFLEKRWSTSVNVVNAGVGGWASSHQLAFVTGTLLPFFEPDALVVLDGVNDVKRSFTAALSPPKPGTPFLDDPTLRRHRRQMHRLQGDPGFVFNQWLYRMGGRRFFLLDRYFLGTMVVRLPGLTSRRRARIDRFEARIRDLRANASIRLPDRLRDRARRRIRALPPPKQNTLEEALDHLPSRRRRIILRGIGGAHSTTWNALWPRQLSSSVRDTRETLLTMTERYFPDAVDRFLDRQPCARVPLDLRPYRARVRTMVSTLAGRKIPVVYALQPTLFLKHSRAHSEQQMVRQVRSRVYSRGMYLYDFPFRTCVKSLYRRFFDRAGKAFHDVNRRSPPTSRVLDWSRLFEGRREALFRDFVHYNGRGSRLIARRLARQLHGLIRNEPSPTH